jgi:hypothetical protein
MNLKIGRNDPCHCGSGKKFKHCHALLDGPEPAVATQSAVPLVLAWLNKHHRKSFAGAIQDILESAVANTFDDDDDTDFGFKAIAQLPTDVLEQLNINATELALASGQMQIKDSFFDVGEVLLGQHGPRLDSNQRDWIEQLSTQTLGLYDVTQIISGKSVTICEALENVTPPILVTERAATQFLRVGEQIGARIMRQNGGFVFSGAIYRFSALAGRELLNELTAERASPDIHPDDMDFYNATTIFEYWLKQYLVEPQMPTIIDQYSGQPMLFVTDFYDVSDKKKLSQILALQSDVHGDAKQGWTRDLICHDGLTRPMAQYSFPKGKKQLSVFYRTQEQAQRGKEWFEKIAGKVVHFDKQTIMEPAELIASVQDDLQPIKQNGEVSNTDDLLPSGIAPVTLSEVFEKMIRRTYANWADEPIPIFKGRTPRQEMQTIAGLERVKGLLRQYEDGEASQAKQQKRVAVSYQFLWNELGIVR